MDKMREEFEGWFFCTYHENKSKHHRAHVFAINPDGTYQCKDCERSWIGWVASRAALCVKLPENCKGMALTVDEFRAQLDTAGVGHE